MNPTEIIVEWFENLPEELQPEIALNFLIAVPDFPFKDELLSGKDGLKSNIEIFPEAFIAWLKHPEWISTLVGARAWVAKTLIENVAFARKKSSQDFENAEFTHKKIIEHAIKEGKGHLIGSVNKITETVRSTEILWLVAYSNWRSLCETDLSDEQISLWVDKNTGINPNHWQ